MNNQAVIERRGIHTTAVKLHRRLESRMAGTTLALAVLLIGVATTQRVHAEDGYYNPDIDLNKNPGCGVKGLSREEKTKRNIRMAEFFFKSYVQAGGVGNSMQHEWSEYNCWADGAKFILGPYMPPPTKPLVMPTGEKLSDEAALKLVRDGKSGGQNEFRLWKKVYPDLGAVPGTFRIIGAWDGGVTWTMSYAGTEETGARYTMWEVDSVRVNDEGRVTQYEFWDDTIGFNVGMLRVTGKTIDDLKKDPIGYLKLVNEKGAIDAK